MNMGIVSTMENEKIEELHQEESMDEGPLPPNNDGEDVACHRENPRSPINGDGHCEIERERTRPEGNGVTVAEGSVFINTDELDRSSAKSKNRHLHCLLSKMRSSESRETIETDNNESCQSTSQLERTYKKALTDYFSVCNRLEVHNASCSKHSSELRTRLREKEKKAERLTQTLQNYKEEIAQQSSFASGKPIDMEMFKEMESRSLGEELERERLRNTSLKVDVSQLEQKIRKKNEMAGGVSHVEFQRLQEDIKRSDEKIRGYHEDFEKITLEEQSLLKLQSAFYSAIFKHEEKNSLVLTSLKSLDECIEQQRSDLAKLEQILQKNERKFGHDRADIKSLLESRLVNADLISSKEELKKLRLEFNELRLHHASLTIANRI